MTVEAISPLRRCMIEESNHPVKLSITHNFCADHGAQSDVGQAR
jgi:hypothetical protein